MGTANSIAQLITSIAILILAIGLLVTFNRRGPK